jgi:hypothetical protein
MTFLQFIVVGYTLTFMIPFIVWNLSLIYFIEDESPGYAFVSTIVFILLIQICSDFSIPGWLNINTGTFIKWGLSYILIGVIYSIVKYILYLTDKKRKFDKAFKKFCSIKKIKAVMEDLPINLKYECSKFIRTEIGYNSLPNLINSTKYIVFWMGYWPWSAFWTILNNPLKWLYEEIKESLSGLFKKLHNKILGNRISAMDLWEKSPKDGNKKKKDDWEI